MDVQILCITKTDRYNPHERITHVGGKNTNGTRWLITQEEAIAYIEKGTYRFYTLVNGFKAWVIVAVHGGRKYIKTQNDSLHPNNLLALASCPV